MDWGRELEWIGEGGEKLGALENPGNDVLWTYGRFPGGRERGYQDPGIAESEPKEPLRTPEGGLGYGHVCASFQH